MRLLRTLYWLFMFVFNLLLYFLKPNCFVIKSWFNFFKYCFPFSGIQTNFNLILKLLFH